MLLIFLVVLLVIMKCVVPPISEVLREREQLVEKTAADNHQAARELGEAESAYHRGTHRRPCRGGVHP